MRKEILFIVLFFVSFTAVAQLKLPALVADSMVLQRDQPVNIWGWNLSGKEVTISFKDKIYKVNPGEDKKWLVTLEATQAGGPYSINISTDDQSLKIKEILFGDVWLCSGQSNMTFAMSSLAKKEADDIAQSINTNIREFQVKRQYSFEPQENAIGKWKHANPTNVLQFSAVAYYMAKNLYEKYKVPVGIIHSSWGGTPAAAWTSAAGLKEFPNYIEKYNYYRDTTNLNATLRQEKAIQNAWYKNIQDNDKGFYNDGNSWANPDFDAGTWKTMQVPGFWETQGAESVDGVVWVRKEIRLTKAQTQQDGVLELGMLDDEDTTYFNGVKVGSSTYKGTLRTYRIPATLLHEGKNVITTRIIDKEGNGGFIKGQKYRLRANNEEIPLQGDWQYNIGFSTSPLPLKSFIRVHYQPATLFNAMIAPLIPYTIKGFVWYQGEADAGKATEYTKLLTALIKGWRNSWQQGDIPFLIVQLANYMAPQKKPSEGGWAWIRESQLKVSQTIPNTALAVAIDIGEAHDIHPLNKKEVGRRLALAAGGIAYNGKSLVYSGPTYQSWKKEGNKMILSFTNIGSGLIAKEGKLARFAIAGKDKKFVWASAKIKGDQVVVWNDSIQDPEAVRYAWGSNPEGCNLYNSEGLPASPFRTDTWER